MKVSIIGAGYVGLVTAACLSEKGNDVKVYDISKDKINRLSKGKMTIHEPGLEGLVKTNLAESRLRFTTELGQSLDDSEVIFLAVGTPPSGDGSADLTFLYKAAESIKNELITNPMKKPVVVATKSTVPPKTGQYIKGIFGGLNDKIFYASVPEFLAEGTAVENFMHPDRIVVGVDSDYAKSVLRDLFRPFTAGGAQLFSCDIETAELSKYASNYLLASRISAMNELARISGAFGADIGMIRKIVGSDERIGSKFLFPGIGYGGSCFPKDVKALQSIAKSGGIDAIIAKAIDEVNENQPLYFANLVANLFNDERYGLKDITIGMWGLSFKNGSDDMRESRALVVLKELLRKGAKVRVYDPIAMKMGTAQPAVRNVVQELGLNENMVIFAEGIYDAITPAYGLVICTDHDAFKSPDFERIKSLMCAPLIVDGRNLYEPEKMEKKGFRYFSIGRK